MTASILRGLEVFCALIEEGSATAAAARLGLSQPAVSQQLARLESELSLTLFVRANGRLHPTETALTLFEEANHAFDGVDRVLNLARDIRSLERGVLRVAAPHSSSGTYLPRALKQLTRGNPHLRVQVHLGTYERIIGLVAARDVDLGLAKAPVFSPSVETIPIRKSGLVAVSARDSAFAASTGLGLSDLSHEPLIMIGRGRQWRDDIDVAFRRAGVVMRVSVETQSVESACGFAAEGFGTAIVPAWLTGGVRRRDIAITPVDIAVEHEFLVVYPKRTQRREIAADFAAALIDVMPG